MRYACLLPSFRWYQIILLGDRGSRVWTTCLRLLRSSVFNPIFSVFNLQPATPRSQVRRPTTKPPRHPNVETVEQRVDGDWRNLSDRCAQLREIIRCLAMQALVHHHPKLVCDSICHIEPMQLRVKQLCQAVVVLLRAAHNSHCSVHDPLQLVGNRLWCSGQQQIAIVDLGRNKGVNQYGCRFVVDWSANSLKLS